MTRFAAMSEQFSQSGGEAVSLAELEWRVATGRANGRLSIQDQLDWGEALLSKGDPASARLLLQSAFIRQGFSPQLQTARGLFDSADAAGVPSSTGDRGQPRENTVELAIRELREFARVFGGSIAAGIARRRPSAGSAAGLHPTAVTHPATSLPSKAPVAELVQGLFQWLNSSRSDPAVDGRAAEAIEHLRGLEFDRSRFDAALFASAEPRLLAGAVALQELRWFLRTCQDLLREPLGSALLFRATARFDSAGLGPYFGNVGHIVHRSANLFELAAIADEAARTVGASVGEEAWVVLLSRSLTNDFWLQVVDDLGDRGAGFALELILDRALAMPAVDIDQPLVMRIRDAALDNLDYDLAAPAQRVICELRPGNMLERRILGAIDASAGYVAAAHQNLSACLEQDPDNRELRLEVEANLARRYAPFALQHGYGSPVDRQLERLSRRAGSQSDRHVTAAGEDRPLSVRSPR